MSTGSLPHAAQPALEEVEVGRQLRHEDAARHLRAVGAVDLRHDQRHELGSREVLHLLGHEATVAHDAAAPHPEDLHRGLQRVLGQADDVEVLGAVGHHLLGLGRLVHRGDAVAQACGAFELQLLGRRQHLGLQARQHRLGVAREEPHEVDHVAVVGLVVDRADTGSRAAVDVVEQARPAQALVALELGVRARAHREAPHQEVERGPDGARVAVGAEVADALALAAAHDGRARPFLVHGDGKPGIALVVLEAHVVARQMGLNQRMLEDERVHLAVDHHPLDVVGLRHHLGRTRGQLGRVLPVVGQSVAQRLRLAHVEHTAFGVEELV